jgi:transposase, IS5 family
MIRRESQQSSVVDAFVNTSNFRNRTLDGIEAAVDWEPIRRKIERRYRKSGPGRPAFPVLVLFKALLLQKWNDLSDPGLEETLADRISFRRFCGLHLEDKVPDHSTIHRFRDRIAPIMDRLLAEIDHQLEAQGLILRKGTLVDATLIQAAARPASSEDDTSADPDARWGGKGDNPIFGYKGHIGLDQESELIRQAEFTPANEHDSTQFEAMISGDEAAAYADKAYASEERSKWLLEHKIEDGILFKGARGRSLTPIQKSINQELTAIRRNIEHVFGTWKRIYHWRRCKYYSYKRNRCDFLVLCIAYNLRRTIKLQAA